MGREEGGVEKVYLSPSVFFFVCLFQGLLKVWGMELGK